MLIASKGKIEVERMKHQLSKEFEMKELGEAHKILGMDIHRTSLQVRFGSRREHTCRRC